jgi:hypothetical protein
MTRTVIERKRQAAPTVTPQALAWHKGTLWMGSRDLSRVYAVDPKTWTVREELEAPGIPWAAVSTGDELRFTLGEGENDDRYVWRFVPGEGFKREGRFACPEFTGSYLSHDGEHLYLSQWYKGRILEMDESGKVLRTIEVGQEICGHTCVDGVLYVLRGHEEPEEEWSIVRLNPREERPNVEDIARVPFAARSLAFDGENFWSNYRANNETICFSVP